VVAALALAGWIALDRIVGLAMAVLLLPMLVLAEWIARTYSSATVWVLFAVFFVGGWAFQLVGHAWEGRRPALASGFHRPDVPDGRGAHGARPQAGFEGGDRRGTLRRGRIDGR
jgi:hypothetical protein